jgi:ssDNA-binding Zn-finger/Zn-ribbon topoisomerase 1
VNPKCKVCGTEMQLRNGRYGEFYFCVKSRVRDLHGTINKDEYDAAAAAGPAKVYRADSEDQQMREHLHRIETAGANTIVDFYVGPQLSESEGDPDVHNILPRG